MKPAIAFIASFVLATAASTGAKVVTTKAAPPGAGADSTAADTRADTAAVPSGTQSAAPLPAPKDSAATKPVAPDTAAAAKVAAAPAAATTATTTPTGASVPPARLEQAVAQAIASTTPDSTTQASEKRLAKVFTSMDAKQAAAVLGHMTDGDVEIILGYVGPRQAASILAEMPAERVATLSKLAMKGKAK